MYSPPRRRPALVLALALALVAAPSHLARGAPLGAPPGDQARWWCDADRLDAGRALGRIRWLRACGLLEHDAHLADGAYLNEHGYPVWSACLPTSADVACWDPERLAQEVFVTHCRPSPETGSAGGAPAASP